MVSFQHLRARECIWVVFGVGCKGEGIGDVVEAIYIEAFIHDVPGVQNFAEGCGVFFFAGGGGVIKHVHFGIRFQDRP
jgi:hypothetical protein